MAKPLNIPKPLPHRILELIQSMLVLRDCIEEVKRGRPHHLIPIYGQLRALLVEKAKNNKSLLIDLASILNQALEVWCMGPAGPEAVPMPEDWKANLLFNVSGFPVSLHQQLPGQKLVNFPQFLDHNILYYNNQHYKVADVIAFFANQAGGAHFATNIKKDFAEILTFNLNGQPALVHFLLQIADVTYELGLRLLKRLNDIEIHVAAIIAEQDIESDRYLFDTKYPNTPMRASIILRADKSIAFSVTGLDGVQVQVVTNRIIDYGKPHYFVFSHSFENNLDSELRILVDGETFGEVSFPRPVLFVNELPAHDTYHNRSFEMENSGAKWAMFSLAMTDPEASVTERSRVSVHFYDLMADEEKSGVVYMPDGFSHAGPGGTNQNLAGNFFWSQLGRLAAGDWGDPKSESNDDNTFNQPL